MRMLRISCKRIGYGNQDCMHSSGQVCRPSCDNKSETSPRLKSLDYQIGRFKVRIFMGSLDFSSSCAIDRAVNTVVVLTVTSEVCDTPYRPPSWLAISRRICKSCSIPYVIITTLLLSSAFSVCIVCMISFGSSVGLPSVRKIMTFVLEVSLPEEEPFSRLKAERKALEYWVSPELKKRKKNPQDYGYHKFMKSLRSCLWLYTWMRKAANYWIDSDQAKFGITQHCTYKT